MYSFIPTLFTYYVQFKYKLTTWDTTSKDAQ